MSSRPGPDPSPPAPSSAPGNGADRPSANRSSRGLARFRRPGVFIALYLLLLDVGANLFFPYPTDPRETSPSKGAQYFEYGRSIEGKLARMTRETPSQSAPIVSSGWLSDVGSADAQKSRRDPNRPTVTFYGMSHAQLLAEDVARQDDSLAVRVVAAPLAVATWSFAAYSRDRERVHSDAVVLAVMTNTISLLSATSGGTMYFDGAYPYTWPRYFLENGALRSIPPPFVSADDYRKFFFDRDRWETYRAWLATHDKYYDPLLFRRTLLDKSSLIRLMRRSYALATRGARQSEVYDDQRGFNASSEEILVLKAIIVEFGRLARLENSIPIVYVVNSLNTGDRAFRLLQPLLLEQGISVLSSHEICAPNDPRNYLADSHFVPSKNAELAQAMARLLHERLAERQPPE
jgi:hypothetical protein